MTCDRCARLEEENAELRRELGLVLDRTHVGLLVDRFNLPTQPSRLLLTLYNAKGRVLADYFLHDAISRKDFRYRDSLVKISVHRVRAVLGEQAIETVRGQGYRLSAVGRARVYQALNPHGVAA